MLQTVIASPLSRKATLVSLNISVWTARRLDRKITDETNKRHHATADAGRYNKLLINAAYLKKINEIASAGRDLFYRFTKPWGDDGARILPNTLYNDFTVQFRELKQKFADAADEFARDFPRYVAERKAELNGMFREGDYPSAKEIRSKFSYDLRIANLPDASDFRSDTLDADTVADIRAEIEETARTAEREAMNDTYRQIADVVGHMAEKLGEYKTSKKERRWFADSLVGNVRDLAKLLPDFNLVGDARIDALTNRITKELCAEEAQTLRDDDKARASVKKSAESILADVQSIMA